MFGLKDKILLGLSLVLLVALLAFGAYHKITVSALRAEIASQLIKISELTVENATLTAANEKLSQSIETQNAKIKQLAAAQEAASKEADKAIAKAQADSRKWRGKYQELFNAPRASEDDCKDLAVRLDQYIELRKGEESP